MALTTKDKEYIDCHFDKLRKLITENQIDIAVLKVKAGVWGLIGGSIPILITVGVLLISRLS